MCLEWCQLSGNLYSFLSTLSICMRMVSSHYNVYVSISPVNLDFSLSTHSHKETTIGSYIVCRDKWSSRNILIWIFRSRIHLSCTWLHISIIESTATIPCYRSFRLIHHFTRTIFTPQMSGRWCTWRRCNRLSTFWTWNSHFTWTWVKRCVSLTLTRIHDTSTFHTHRLSILPPSWTTALITRTPLSLIFPTTSSRTLRISIKVSRINHVLTSFGSIIITWCPLGWLISWTSGWSSKWIITPHISSRWTAGITRTPRSYLPTTRSCWRSTWLTLIPLMSSNTGPGLCPSTHLGQRCIFRFSHNTTPSTRITRWTWDISSLTSGAILSFIAPLTCPCNLSSTCRRILFFPIPRLTWLLLRCSTYPIYRTVREFDTLREMFFKFIPLSWCLCGYEI